MAETAADRALEESWWRQHPAFEALTDSYRYSTSAPAHLAFLTLTGLRARGFEVVEAAPDA